MENFRTQSPPSTPDSSIDSSSELPSLVSQEQIARSNLRRNSISLPVLTIIDLEGLKRLDHEVF